MDMFKNACWIHTRFLIARYLISNAEGRLDGAEKAKRHIELCQFYVAAVRGHKDPEKVRLGVNEEVDRVHDKTQKLTSYLDEQIGFPLTGRPDYEKLEPLFFEKWHELAMDALNP